MNSADIFNALYKNIKFDDYFLQILGKFEALILVFLLKDRSLSLSKQALLDLKPFLNLEDFINLNPLKLSKILKSKSIKKSEIIINFCQNLISEFGDFEYFKSNADRDWLIQNRGVSLVSVDEIFSFVLCKKNMAVSSSMLKILKCLNFEFDSYFEAKEWIECFRFDKNFYDFKSENEFFCAYQILAYEFANLHFKGLNLSSEGREILSKIKFI
ncbi:hypothetical protein F1B92_02440 [Campylobacter sp. FMV-PI01]|uniref:Endonuclease III n=1 Tax=Campylobacter portucalensis TaxID=2608384 RepID=A0A6L5WJY3_9BACT|nr:hypothetical protein [Campylobacter portucalensis]MSN96061.1 hypothetical protein [Campylobacter portucalensis]